MENDLDYAEMLEIPVSTVNVVKKKSLFKRKTAPKPVEPDVLQDDLKELVVDSVNERVGAYVYAEDLSDPPAPVKAAKAEKGGRKANIVIMTELVAVCVIAIAIFVTNIFMPNSVINTFIGTLTAHTESAAEPTYSQIKLSPVVSELSEAEVSITDNGVLCFKGESAVYPVCAGTVSAISGEAGAYTVQIAHTSTFSSVITGLTDVYAQKDTKVQANIPFAYSNGENEVRVSMYDGDTLLNCYTLAGEVPVWNS